MREKTKKYFSEYNVLESVEHALKTLSTNHKKEIEELKDKLEKYIVSSQTYKWKYNNIKHQLQTQRDNIFKEIERLWNTGKYQTVYDVLEHLKQKHLNPTNKKKE